MHLRKKSLPSKEDGHHPNFLLPKSSIGGMDVIQDRTTNKQKLLSRTLSLCFHQGSMEENVWTQKDEVRFNVEKEIMKAKAQAKTVSVVDGDLYIDYQYVCEMPFGVHV